MVKLRQAAGGVALLCAVVLMTVGAASGASLFVIGEGPYEPTDGKLTVEVVNLSGAELAVELESGRCGSTNAVKVPSDTTADVTFELVAGCDVEAPVEATIAGRSAAGNFEIPILLTAPDDDSESDLSPLVGYWIGLGGAFVLTAGALIMGIRKLPRWADVKAPMPWLGKGWKFDESWAANAGVAAAIFTGVFGAADVLDELLGKDADTTVAVIGAALTAGLVGAAPMLLTMCKSGGKHTRAGVFLGTWAVLTAHLGLIITLVLMLNDGDAATPAWIAGIGGMALLAIYTLLTLHGVFKAETVTETTAPDVLALLRIAEGVDRISEVMGNGPPPTVAGDRDPAAELRQRAALI